MQLVKVESRETVRWMLPNRAAVTDVLFCRRRRITSGLVCPT